MLGRALRSAPFGRYRPLVRRISASAPAADPGGDEPGTITTVLSWNASAGATSYKVYRGTSSGSYNYNWNVGNVTSCDVNLLTPLMVFSTTYYFAVAAIDGGGEGAKSSEILVLNWVQI
jgi:hypothetical protein